MDVIKPVLFFLASAYVIAMPLSACAQNEISRRIESQTGLATPIQVDAVNREGVISVIDEVVPVREGRTTSASGNMVPGAQMVTSEVEIITFGYQLPDFDPADLYTHRYSFGVFFENGNGSGTLNPDTAGYIEYDVHMPAGEDEVQTYVYSIDAETGEAKVFADIDDLTVNTAVNILTSVARNSRMNTQRFNRAETGFRPRPSYRHPPEIGNQRTMYLYGEYLTLTDIQEEIFRQTRCDVEEEDGSYYLQACL